jgi:serine/threonine protein kinase
VDGGSSEPPDGTLPVLTAGSYVAGYRLEEQIGTGGMAVVFRAWDRRLDRQVALKILAPPLAANEIFRRWFLREARSAAAVDHPHVIPVFEAGEAGGALFMAMRYVPGGDVRSLVRRAGRLSLARAAAIVSSAASALDAAHAAGLVHRDVKPANILVDVRPGQPDHVYLSDFGVCQAALSWSGPTAHGQVLGTIGYAAPEQLGGKPVRGPADQYSLGCVAFELLGGAPPFPREEPAAAIWAHLSEPRPRLTSLRPQLPAAIDSVLARALATNPDDRYASCRDFASALCAALGLALSSVDAAVSPETDLSAETGTWPSTADAEPAAGIAAMVGAVTLSRRHRARTRRQASGPRGRAGLNARARTAPATGRHHNRQRLRVSVMPAALLAAVLSILGSLLPLHPFGHNVTAAHHATLVSPSRPSSYLGVDVPGRPDYRAVADFAAAAGRTPNLVGYFSGWAEPFNSGFAQMLHRHHVVPLVQIEPTDASVAAIAAGSYDDYLTAYADAVRDFGHPVVISFGDEMNASWSSWGSGHVSPHHFIAAWQHVVTLFRQQGADNVTWLWTVQADTRGTAPIALWWPGAKYVSWVGIDGFYYRPSDTFEGVFVQTIDDIRAITGKPILLSETAVGPAAGQFAKIQDLFRGMVHYRLLGLVWFDVDQHGGIYHQDWRIQGSQAAEDAFRLGVRHDLVPGPTPPSSPTARTDAAIGWSAWDRLGSVRR